MTVCIAAICKYGYAFDAKGKMTDSGSVVVTASDRMLTAERYGIEYEPATMKRAQLSHSVELLVADDIVVHSEVAVRALREIGPNSHLTVKQAADIYAKHFRELTSEEAEQLYLSPLKLDLPAFLSGQHGMSESIALELTNNILKHRLDAEALIVGVDGDLAQIYHMDSHGILTCHSDIGFATIGIGTMHSNSLFMSSSYGAIFPYYTAFPLVYAAKRRAEVAPGVGKFTDMSFISRDGVFFFEQERIKILQKHYDEHQRKLGKLFRKTLENFSKADVAWLNQRYPSQVTQSSAPNLPSPKDDQQSPPPSRG